MLSANTEPACLGDHCRTYAAFVPGSAIDSAAIEVTAVGEAAPLAAEDGSTPSIPSNASFSLLDPPGSVIGRSETSGEIVAAGQQDIVSLSVEDGQMISVVVEPAGTLVPRVEFADEAFNALAAATATAAGEPVILQTIPLTKAGDHSVIIEGDAGSIGQYSVSIYLNAAIEEEAFTGGPNDDFSSAQDLDSAFISLESAASTRAAVVGQRDLDRQENFESGSLNEEWTTFSTNAIGRIRVTDAVPPIEGRFSLVMDQGPGTIVTRKEATWTVDLAGVTDATLSFFHTEYDDTEDVLPASYTGSVNGDGVSISEDGNQWHTVLNATNVPPDEWAFVSVDLDQAATTAGISLDDEFFIKFQQFGDGSVPVDGRAYDDIRIETIPELPLSDWYRFTLNDGQTMSAVLDSLELSRGTLELYDPTQTLVATSSGLTNAEHTIQNLTDQTTNATPDDYWIRVRAPSEEYSLVVTRDATFDRESNSSFELAQDPGESSEALGFVSDLAGPALNLIQSFSGPEFTNFVPPDPTLAVGPEQVVALVNTTLSIYDKASGAEQFTQTLNRAGGFFGGVGAESVIFDPWVIFDADSERFFIVGIDIPNDFESNVYLAVSTSPTPDSGTDWHKYRFDFTHDPEPLGLGVGAHFPDYEKLGVSDDAIFIAGNYFTIESGTGIYSGITALEKSSLLNGEPANIVYEEFFDGFSVFPLNQFDSGSTQYFAEAIGNDQVRMHAVTDVLTNPVRHTFDLAVDAYEPPVDIPQLGGASAADSLGERIMTGVWRDGSAWFAHTIIDPAIGDGEDVARWYEVATNNFPAADPTLIQVGNVDPGPNVHAWVPAIAVDGAGNMGIGFATGGPNQYFGAAFTGRLATDPPGQTALPVTELAAGEAEYVLVSGSRNRWGDYTGMAIDPSDDSTFWVMNEYANASGVWDTRIGSFQVDDVPDSDYYLVYVSNGNSLVIQTQTPFSDALDLVNDLDPDLELYAPNGDLIASDADSGSNLNALISHTATQAGQYRVRVLTGGGQGTYVLQVDGATGFDPPPVVRRSVPGDGQLVGRLPDVVRLDFSEPILVSSVQPADVTINGAPALSVNVAGEILEFTIDPAVNVGDGVYTVELSAGSVIDYQGNLLADAFVSTFQLDTTGPVIASTRWNGSPFPADATISPGPLTFEADLSEDLFLLASARRGLRAPGVDDVVLIDDLSNEVIPEHGLSYDPATDVFSVSYAQISEGSYTLTLKSGAGAFEDNAGNALDGEFGPGADGTPTGDGNPGGDYQINFIVDVDVIDAQFSRVEPGGSLIARSAANSGYVDGNLDQDAFRFFAHAGESISALATIDGNVIGTLQLVGATTLVPPTSAAAAGEDIYVPPITIPRDGFYQAQISADGATFYNLDLVRNAVNESGIGDSDPGNEIPVVASPLDFISGHYGIVGSSDLRLEFAHFNDPAQFVDISTTGIPTDLSDDGELVINSTINSKIVPAGDVTIANNGAIAVGDENIFFQNLPLPAPDIGRALFPYWDDFDDASGNVFYEERDLNGVPTLIVQWQRPHFDLPGSEVVFQLQLPEGDGRLARFAYQDIEFGNADYDFGNSATIGYQESAAVAYQFSFGLVERDPAFAPEVNVVNGDVVDFMESPDVDVYALDLSGQVGKRLDIALAGQDGTDFSGELLELLDESDQVVAAASTDPLGGDASNFDLAILDLVVPDVGSNVYRLRLTSSTAGNYGIVITDSVLFDTEPNDAVSDSLRDLPAGVGASLGFLDDADGVDSYQLDVVQGELVFARLIDILDSPSASPLNSLNPELVVLAADDTTVLASDQDSLDGRGAIVSFTAPATETVTLQAIRTTGTGEYLLTTSTTATGQPATLTIDDITLDEGDAEVTDFSFTVTRSHNDGHVFVQAATRDDTATAGEDYQSMTANLSFEPGGSLTETVTISVFGDLDDEADERFAVDLTNPFGALIQRGTGSGIIVNDDAVAPVPPRIQAVTLGSDAWQMPFIDDLDPVNQLGYEIPKGTNQLRTAPWANVDRIYVTFTKDVGASFTAANVSLNGVLVQDYESMISGTSFDSATLTGTIRLSAPIGRDKLLLSIDDSVVDASGVALDGEWFDTVTLGDSGDGVAGGDFVFRFNLLPGDADQDGGFSGGGVGGFDLDLLVNSFFQPIGGASYSPFINFDGDGGIGGVDLDIFVNSFFTALPPGEPVSGLAALPATGSSPDNPAGIDTPLEAIDASLRDWPDNLDRALEEDYSGQIVDIEKMI